MREEVIGEGQESGGGWQSLRTTLGFLFVRRRGLFPLFPYCFGGGGLFQGGGSVQLQGESRTCIWDYLCSFPTIPIPYAWFLRVNSEGRMFRFASVRNI